MKKFTLAALTLGLFAATAVHAQQAQEETHFIEMQAARTGLDCRMSNLAALSNEELDQCIALHAAEFNAAKSEADARYREIVQKP